MGTSRFAVVDAYVKQPGACFICRGLETPAIDTSHWVPAQGSVYLCINCVTEMYNELVGPVEIPVKEVRTVENAKEINGTVDSIADSITDLVGGLAALRGYVEPIVETVVKDDEPESGEGTGSDGAKSDSGKSTKQSSSK